MHFWSWKHHRDRAFHASKGILNMQEQEPQTEINEYKLSF